MSDLYGRVIIKAPMEIMVTLEGKRSSVRRQGLESLFSYAKLKPLKEYHPIFAEHEDASLLQDYFQIVNGFVYMEIETDIWRPLLKPLVSESENIEAYIDCETPGEGILFYSVNDKGDTILEMAKFGPNFDADWDKAQGLRAANASEEAIRTFPSWFESDDSDDDDDEDSYEYFEPEKYKVIDDGKFEVLKFLEVPKKPKFWFALMPDNPESLLVDHKKAEIMGPFKSCKIGNQKLKEALDNNPDYLFTPVFAAPSQNDVLDVLKNSAWGTTESIASVVDLDIDE